MELTRRELIATSGVVAASTAIAGASTAVADEAAWNEEYDIVIVGAGGAGYVTALTAAESDPEASILIIEKQSFVGGSSILSGGNIGAFDTDVVALGAADDPDYYSGDTLEMYYEDKISSGDFQSDPELVRLFVDNSQGNYEWLKSLGITWTQTKSYEKAVYEPSDLDADPLFGASMYLQEFDEEGVYPGIGRKCRYNYMPNYKDLTKGVAVMQCLQDHTHAHGNVTLQLETALTSIIREGGTAGDVQGIVATASDGTEKRIKANRAVVLTCGGFCGNGEMMHLYNGKVHPDTPPSGGVGNTGDGLIAAQLVGAQTVNMHATQADFGWAVANPSYYTTKSTNPFGSDTSRFIELSPQGERFWAEVPAAPQYIEAKLTKLAYMGTHTWWRLGDAASVAANGDTEEDLASFADGIGYICETLEDVASVMGCDPETVEATVEAYNSFVDSGIDTDCGKPARFLTQKIESAPYYVYQVLYTCRSTPGGLRIAPNTQVLDVKGEPIPRLYAAGEVTGNLHGRFRNTGGDSWTDITCFGRIAGAEVAALA